MKRRRLALKGGGAMDGTIDSKVYLFIDSHQLEATVGSIDLFKYRSMFLEVLMRCCNSYMQLAHLN
jgi:hypothetical protein